MARIPICICKNCGSIGSIRVDIDKRGGRNAYMCDFHARRLMGYSDENSTRSGDMKKHGFTFSIELETSFSDMKARGELLDFGFIPTSDCTVDIEYKSPIYQGLNAISKQATSIEKLMNVGCLSINSTCGTHFHVGHETLINPITMGYLKRFYHSIFVPLSDACTSNPERAARLFGRDLSGRWAMPIDAYTHPERHENFINLQHDFTIEFRACKFINAAQYMNCVKFCRDVTATVIENFIKHFNDEDFDRRRYADVTAYRKHKAQVTAAKIVKLFDKYAN